MEIHGNGIYDNRDCGILCSGKVDIEENDVVCNQGGGITVESHAAVKVGGIHSLVLLKFACVCVC
jgi:hypothetical protein